MRVLIVEDDENKRKQVTNFVEEIWPASHMDVERSLQSGLRSILLGDLDVIVLDMSLPTFDVTVEEDGGRLQAYAGREILRQMDRRQITVPVVVVTQFDKFGEGAAALTREELDAQLRHAHPQIYCGMVYYNVALDGWKDDLRWIIDRLKYSLGGSGDAKNSDR